MILLSSYTGGLVTCINEGNSKKVYLAEITKDEVKLGIHWHGASGCTYHFPLVDGVKGYCYTNDNKGVVELPKDPIGLKGCSFCKKILEQMLAVVNKENDRKLVQKALEVVMSYKAEVRK
jgi:hypothetical protein